MTLREKIDAAPTKPGSYVFRDARGKVLYVGKTISLRKRLHDWFSPSKGGHSPWSATMLKRVGDIEIGRAHV